MITPLKLLVATTIAGLTLSLGCADAGMDSTGFDDTVGDQLLGEESTDSEDLVEKAWVLDEPELNTGDRWLLQSRNGSNIYFCGSRGNGIITQGALPQCSFELVGSSLSNVRLVFNNGRLRGSGSKNGNGVVIGGGTSFSKFRLQQTGGSTGGVSEYYLFAQATQRVVDIEARRSASGSNVHIWRQLQRNNNNQRWVFRRDQ